MSKALRGSIKFNFTQSITENLCPHKLKDRLWLNHDYFYALTFKSEERDDTQL